MKLVVRAKADGPDSLRVQTNLRQLDPCLHPTAFAALAAHLGYDPEPMAMAVRGKNAEPPDPRYPALTSLIAKARRDWARWGTQLVERVSELLKNGDLMPMSQKSEQALIELFRDHEVQIVARFAGYHPDHARLKSLIKRGLVSPTVVNASYVDVSYRLARGLEALQPHMVPDSSPAALEETIREAMRYKLTPRDRKALHYAKKEAAVMMRRPASVLIGEVERVVHYTEEQRVLTPEELGVIRGAVTKTVRHEGSGNLVKDLHRAVEGHPTLVNDMQRVARTELVNVHGYGGYIALKEAAAARGEDDPEVYKFVSPYACADCRRIWGDPGNPRRYRLSYIEEREASGGNFRMSPRSAWGPVRGAVHPNCTEGPLQYWNQALVESINRAAEGFLEAQGD